MRLFKKVIILICVIIIAVILGGCSPIAVKPAATVLAPVSDLSATLKLTAEPEIAQMPAPEPTLIVAIEEEKEYMKHGFVSVGEYLDNVLLDVRYYTDYNFVGQRIDGYHAPVVLLSIEAADALKNVSELLAAQGYIIKIYDGYRPQQAVDHFVRWAADIDDQRMKSIFYPDIDKDRLFDGYIAKKSGHTRGSTVDLTIVDTATGNEVDMGSPFDLLGEISNHRTGFISTEQSANRNILRDAMEQSGFKAYSKEWWHYTLKYEPYPDTYFNFPVE